MYNPLELPAVARKITDRLHGAFDKTHHDLLALVRAAMDELDMTYILAKTVGNKPPADMTEYVERLVKAIQHAKSERTAVLSVLDTGEIDFLYTTDRSSSLKKVIPRRRKKPMRTNGKTKHACCGFLSSCYSQGGKNNSINYKTQWGILLDTH